jgi:hypothetical protein
MNNKAVDRKFVSALDAFLPKLVKNFINEDLDDSLLKAPTMSVCMWPNR